MNKIETEKRVKKEIRRLAKMSLMGGSSAALVFEAQAADLAKRYNLWAYKGQCFNFNQN